MNKSLKIYIAYRYSVPSNVIDILANIGTAIEAGVKLIMKGHYPYVPHLDCLLAIHSKGSIPKPFYYKYCLNWVEACDAILILDCRDLIDSYGVKLEYDYAVKLRKKVFLHIDDIPTVKGDWEKNAA